ncbi:MAG TPA: hypothetical protein VMJ75_11345 [Candidatus Acidoferrales bacterium]|nr:hypothetical protein [Candidatus Acidoferrales bacterium]
MNIIRAKYFPSGDARYIYRALEGPYPPLPMMEPNTYSATPRPTRQTEINRI